MLTVRKNNETYYITDYETDYYIMSCTRLYAGKETNGHSHDHDELYFIAQGAGVLILDGQEIDIHTEQFKFISGGQFHKIRNTGDKDLLFLCCWDKKS